MNIALLLTMVAFKQVRLSPQQKVKKRLSSRSWSSTTSTSGLSWPTTTPPSSRRTGGALDVKLLKQICHRNVTQTPNIFPISLYKQKCQRKRSKDLTATPPRLRAPSLNFRGSISILFLWTFLRRKKACLYSEFSFGSFQGESHLSFEF